MHATLNGPRTVTRTVRPPRLAFVVSTISHCEELVKICSLTWGGKYFCIVPYTETDGISEDWWKLLSLYDPDMIFSSLPLDEATEKRLLDMIATTWPRLNNRTPEHIGVKNPSHHMDFVTGISLYSVLVALEAYGNAENFPTASVPKFPENNPHRLYVTAKYGDLDEIWTYSILSRLGINPELRLQDFISVKTFDVSDNYADDIIYSHWHVYQSEENRIIPLIDYTEFGLKIQTSGRPMDKYGEPSIVFDIQQLIIVSEDISVEDFCWYWILRPQRYVHGDRFPLWISKETLLTYTEHIAGLIHPGEKSFLLSKTIPYQELEGIARSFGEKMAIATNELYKFYAEEFFIGIKDRQEVYFHENRTQIAVPQHDVVRYRGDRQYYCLDIEIPNYMPPRLNISDWGLWLHKNYRVSRTGMSFDVRTWTSEPTQYIALAIPTAWQMLEAFAELAGYTVELSDKGKVAEQVIQLVGGMEYFWLLAIPPVHRLFEELSELYQAREFRSRLRKALKRLSIEETEEAEKRLIQAIATDRHERIYKTYGNIKETLSFKSNETIDLLLDWLIHRRMLFRGVEIACTVCKTKQWLHLDQINSVIKCNGCQQTIDIPLNPSSTVWSYRANALYAKAYDLGVIPHLMTLRYCTAHREDRRPGIIAGTFPGIVLKAQKDKEVSLPEIEIDIAWIENGELIIGECKTNAKELTASEVARYITIAQLLRCKKIIIGTLDDFSHALPETRSTIASSPVSIEVVTGTQFLGSSPDNTTTPVSSNRDYEKSIKSFFEWEEATKALRTT